MEKLASLSLSSTSYVNETAGKDETGYGTQQKPFASAAYALFVTGSETIFVWKAGQEGAEDAYEPISASAIKKARKGADGLKKKAEKAAKAADAQAEKIAAESQRVEAAKAIVIKEDPSLPTATKIKVRDAVKHASSSTRVRVSGWIHRLRPQKDLVFAVVRDGTGFLQVVLAGPLARAYSTSTLTLESTVTVTGLVKPVPESQSAPGGLELAADYYEIVGLAPSGDDAINNKVQKDADPSILLDQRHLALRGDTLSAIMKVRAVLLRSFRAVYDDLGFTEVTPPCMVQTQVEGGSTLFKLDYYGQEAYLTQSSQLYLETMVPVLGDVFCVQESFRAEKSHTRRHLSEYTHLEGEMGFLTFEDLLQHIETLICDTVDKVLADPVAGPLVKQLNPKFQAPARPFMRMQYVDALDWLNEHGVLNEDQEKFKFGDDIAEAAERKMTDDLGVPILLNRFPLELKSFYMQKTADDDRLTESVDVLMPNVGEIVGGSMRSHSIDDLLAGMKREGIDPTAYYWFLDQARYGAFPHGGYGLGTERILAWLCDRFTVRDCQMYPRFTDRCTP